MDFRMQTPKNNLVAVLPFADQVKEEKPQARGLDLTDLSVAKLIKTTVAFDGPLYKAGDIVYVRADTLRVPQFKQKYEINGKTFLLLPEDTVVLFEKAE